MIGSANELSINYVVNYMQYLSRLHAGRMDPVVNLKLLKTHLYYVIDVCDFLTILSHKYKWLSQSTVSFTNTLATAYDCPTLTCR